MEHLGLTPTPTSPQATTSPIGQTNNAPDPEEDYETSIEDDRKAQRFRRGPSSRPAESVDRAGRHCASRPFADADQVAAGSKPRLPRFSMVAYTGGTMKIAGWRFPVVVDLAGLAIPTQSRPIRFGHDMASGVGHTDQIRMEAGKLLAAGVVSRDTPAAKEIVVSARNGFPWQASIGASVDEFEFVKEDQQATVNGREFSGPVNVVRKSTWAKSVLWISGPMARPAPSWPPQNPNENLHRTKSSKRSKRPLPAPRPPSPRPAQVQPTPGRGCDPAARSSRGCAQPDGGRHPRRGRGRKHSGSPRSGSFATDGSPRSRAQAIQEGWDDHAYGELELASLRDGRPKAPAMHVRDD